MPPATAGQAYSLTLVPSGGSSPYNNVVTTGLLPPGVTLSPGGVLSGTPQTPGLYSFGVQSTDAQSVTGLTNLTLRVAGTTGLTISTMSLPEGKTGTAYDTTLTATGGMAPYSFDLVIGGGVLPPGLWITSAGRIYGTPSSAGVFPLTVRVTDSVGNSYRASMTLTIGSGSLSLTTVSLVGASSGLPYSQTISASGGTGPYTYAVGTGTLPAGLTLSNGGLISGTPTAVGSYSFSVQTTDSTGATAQSNYSLAVSSSSPQAITNTIPNGVVNSSFAYNFRTQGGTSPYTYSVTTGTLPPGLTLAATGAVTGTPTTSGSYPVTIKVTDAGGKTTNTDVTFNVNSGSFGISNVTLQPGYVNSKYSAKLGTTGAWLLMSSCCQPVRCLPVLR